MATLPTNAELTATNISQLQYRTRLALFLDFIRDAFGSDGTLASMRSAFGLGAMATLNTVGAAQIGDGAVTAAKESDDDWAGVASAATVDLGAQTSRKVLITGTTPITSFGNTGTAGRERTTRFGGVLPLTNSANLILGVSAITTAAGDIAVWQKETGTAIWRLTRYTRADGSPLALPTFAARLDTSQSFTAGQTPQTGALIDGATVNWDLSARQSADISPAAGRTFAAPTNHAPGRYYVLDINNGASNLTHGFNTAAFKWNGGPSNAPGAFTGRMIVTFKSDGTSLNEVGRSFPA
jgi:hypothetical protein